MTANKHTNSKPVRPILTNTTRYRKFDAFDGVYVPEV